MPTLTLRVLLVIVLLAPRLEAQIPRPLVTRPLHFRVNPALMTRVDTAEQESVKPLIIGALIGAAVGLYFGELARGSCERPGCAEEYDSAPYIGVVGGAIVGALAGELIAHLPRAGPR